MTDANQNTPKERLSAYLDDALAPAERAAFEKELAASANLRRDLARLKSLRSILRSMPPPAPTETFYRNVRRAAEPRRWRFVLPPLAAAAAAALIMVGIRHNDRPTVALDALSPEGSTVARRSLAAKPRFLESGTDAETVRRAALPADRPSSDYNAAAAPSEELRLRESGAVADKKDFPDVLAKQRLQAAEPRAERGDGMAPPTVSREEKEKLPAGPRPAIGDRKGLLEKAKVAEFDSPVPAAPPLATLPAEDDGNPSRSLSEGFGGGTPAAGTGPTRTQNALVRAAKPAPAAVGSVSKDEAALSAREGSKKSSIAGFRIPSKTAARAEWRGDDSGVLQFRTVVVRDAAAWKTLWAEHAALRVPPPPAPDVDFSRDMVVGVFLGQKPSGGYEAMLVDFRAGAEGATVTYQTATPDPDQSQITVLTAPYHLRVVPRTARPVRFKKIS